jgi:hypothetical protein
MRLSCPDGSTQIKGVCEQGAEGENIIGGLRKLLNGEVSNFSPSRNMIIMVKVKLFLCLTN